MAWHGTARKSAPQHSKAQHNIARRTKAHHSTKASDANRANPNKPPHIPERKGTRPQPWDNTTPAHHARARGHHRAVGRTPPPPAGGRPPAQTTTRKLNRQPPNRHCNAGGTRDNPTPLTHDPTKPAGATAKQAEAEPNPPGQATSPCVYITYPTHGAGARPAATHNTNSNPVNHPDC